MSADRIIEGFSMKKLFLDVSGKEFFLSYLILLQKIDMCLFLIFLIKNYSIKIKRLSQ